jgi:hypothetical protein
MKDQEQFNPVGKWLKQYEKADQTSRYGDEDSYLMGCTLLQGLASVEDWGCGLGYARKYFNEGCYKGVDGSLSKFCDEVDDLTTRQSQPDGIFLRHVLEHNLEWEKLLRNAVACAQKRLVVVGFTRLARETTYAWDVDGYPCIEFKAEDIEKCFDGLLWTRAASWKDTVWLIKK